MINNADSQKVNNGDIGFQQPLDKVVNPTEKKETKPKETLPVDTKGKNKEKGKQPVEKKEEKEELKPTPSEPIVRQPVAEPVSAA